MHTRTKPIPLRWTAKWNKRTSLESGEAKQPPEGAEFCVVKPHPDDLITFTITLPRAVALSTMTSLADWRDRAGTMLEGPRKFAEEAALTRLVTGLAAMAAALGEKVGHRTFDLNLPRIR